MAKKARSARGELVDFDVLTIKQQLAANPVPVGVDQRRKFIDEKGGLKVRTVQPAPALPSALSIASDAAATSAASSQTTEAPQED